MSCVLYSRYVKFLMEQHDYQMTLRNEVVTAREVYENLSNAIQNVYDDVMSNGYIDKDAHPEEFRLYDNPFHVTEGTW